MKRLFDIFFSMFGLIMLLPFFALIALLIKIESPGTVFYMQKRIGMKYKPFYIYKFRSMVQDADKKGLQITAGGDKRITNVGRILRKIKADELPQLINVLMGDMSFVGPRPEVEKYVNLYHKDYEKILSVRPGITDISSITFRDEEGVLKKESDPESYYENVLLPQKIKLAKDYIDGSSIFLDIKLIFMTFIRIIVPSSESKNYIDHGR